MLEAAGKLGKICTGEQALPAFPDTGVWQQCSVHELQFRYNHYSQQRVSIYYTPYSDRLTKSDPAPDEKVIAPILQRRA